MKEHIEKKWEKYWEKLNKVQNKKENALVQVLLPTRILKERIEKDIKNKNYTVEISGSVIKNEKSSGECDIIITDKKNPGEYGIFDNKVKIIIEWERNMPSGKKFCNFKKHITGRLNYVTKIMIILICEVPENKATKGGKSYNEKVKELEQLAKGKGKSARVYVYDYNEMGVPNMIKKIRNVFH